MIKTWMDALFIKSSTFSFDSLLLPVTRDLWWPTSQVGSWHIPIPSSHALWNKVKLCGQWNLAQEMTWCLQSKLCMVPKFLHGWSLHWITMTGKVSSCIRTGLIQRDTSGCLSRTFSSLSLYEYFALWSWGWTVFSSNPQCLASYPVPTYFAI